MTATQYFFLSATLAGFVIFEYALGYAQKFSAYKSDNLLDLLCFVLLAAFTQPFIFWVVKSIGLRVAPGYENALIDLPWYAMVGLLLVANALGWFSHRQWHRSLLGMVGPTLVLGALGWLGGEGWPTQLLYVGLGLMLAVSAWDLLWPANRRCGARLNV